MPRTVLQQWHKFSEPVVISLAKYAEGREKEGDWLKVQKSKRVQRYSREVDRGWGWGWGDKEED